MIKQKGTADNNINDLSEFTIVDEDYPKPYSVTLTTLDAKGELDIMCWDILMVPGVSISTSEGRLTVERVV